MPAGADCKIRDIALTAPEQAFAAAIARGCSFQEASALAGYLAGDARTILAEIERKIALMDLYDLLAEPVKC